MITVRSINKNDIDKVSELVAGFRVELSNLKGIKKEPDSDPAGKNWRAILN
jgi:hypothetical protein